jgi:hypothetical protein
MPLFGLSDNLRLIVLFGFANVCANASAVAALLSLPPDERRELSQQIDDICERLAEFETARRFS